MGFCRAGNLLLGISIVPTIFTSLIAEGFSLIHPTYLAIIPILYIGAITAISQGEVYGGSRRTGQISVALMGVVIAILLGCAIDAVASVAKPIASPDQISALLFVALLAWRIFPPFIQAAANPEADLIRSAVKAGILSLIIVNATLAACFAGGIYGVLVLALLPLSLGLARLFAMT